MISDDEKELASAQLPASFIEQEVIPHPDVSVLEKKVSQEVTPEDGVTEIALEPRVYISSISVFVPADRVLVQSLT